MNFTPVRNLNNKITYYASDIQTLIIESPLGKEFNKSLPNYIILKEDNKYYSMMLHERISDYMQENGYITNSNDIYNEYQPLFNFKTLKEAKEYINELELKDAEWASFSFP